MAKHTSTPHHNEWLILAVIAVAQLMVVLDGTIVNIALPSAQKALHFSTENRQWIITAYALAFGGLLLLGGKLGDLFGRKWTFIVGLLGFAGVSAVGGFADSFGVLVAARALQGVFAAILAPSALSLLAVTFNNSPDRPKAFGIFGAVAGTGASIGLLLGGALTSALSWRWCLFVNLIFAVPAAIASLRLVPNVVPENRPKIDFAGIIIATLGVFAIVFGFSNAETNSWSAPATIAAIVIGPILLAVFVVIEHRSRSPLLPLHIVTDRTRGGIYAMMALASCAMMGMFLFLTYYLQQNLGYSPIVTGVAFIPMSLAIMIASITTQTRLLPRFGPKPLVIIGSILGALGTFYLTQLPDTGDYPSHVLPALIVFGLGLGLLFACAFGMATVGVEHHETGVASAMVNTAQQVGGSIGVAVLSTIFASALVNYMTSHRSHSPATVLAASAHGDRVSFVWAGVLFLAAISVAVFVIPSKRLPLPHAMSDEDDIVLPEPL